MGIVGKAHGVHSALLIVWLSLLGVRKRQLLLNTFGGLQGVQSAGVEELMQVRGINRETAQAIYDSFHA